MPSGSSSKSKPKPADVASETKRKFIPQIREEYADRYQINSYLYHQPLAQLDFHSRLTDYVSPNFCTYTGAPARCGGC
jgi:hypothetical protein